jgi:hypothetical protein
LKVIRFNNFIPPKIRNHPKKKNIIPKTTEHAFNAISKILMKVEGGISPRPNKSGNLPTPTKSNGAKSTKIIPNINIYPA